MKQLVKIAEQIEKTNVTSVATVEELIDTIETIKQIESVVSEWKAQTNKQMIMFMNENRIKTISNERITITFIPESTVLSVDSVRLKAEDPEVYTKYLKWSKKSAYIRISKAKNEESD